MEVTGIDQVVPPGGTVAALVPAGQELLAELVIAADRIGSIAPGHSVNVKVLTFDFTRFGTIAGEVIDVSPTSEIAQNGIPTYRVRVALSKDHLGASDGRLEIRPGLAVVGDIILGERTVMEYLLKPLRVARDRAMTEA
jgi:multidrug efflux pump subunit AcrA (membrane-fusion protein)